MKKLHFQFIIIGLLLMSGCSDDDEPKFVKGNVIVGFEKGVTIRQAYDFATQNANGIGTVSGFFFYSNLPNDSLNYVANTLAEAGFPNGGVRIGFVSNRIEIILFYHIDDDKSTLGEWVDLTEVSELEFEVMQIDKSMLLYINPGTEKQWKKNHINDPLIKYIELDYIR